MWRRLVAWRGAVRGALRRYETILLPAFEELVVHTQVNRLWAKASALVDRHSLCLALVATAQCEAAAHAHTVSTAVRVTASRNAHLCGTQRLFDEPKYLDKISDMIRDEGK